MARCYSRAVGRRDFSAVLARRRAIRRARRPLAAGALDLVHRAVGPLEQAVGPRVRVVRHSAARAGADDDRRESRGRRDEYLVARVVAVEDRARAVAERRLELGPRTAGASRASEARGRGGAARELWRRRVDGRGAIGQHPGGYGLAEAVLLSGFSSWRWWAAPRRWRCGACSPSAYGPARTP